MAIPGVIGVVVSAEKAQAIITSESEISGDAIESAVRAAGYSLLH
jgi:copper chaperone CopZ